MARQIIEKFTGGFRVLPQLTRELVMESTGFGRHPDFLQRFLQVDDDLAMVCKGQRDHAARALIVNIGIGVIVEAIAR